MERERDGLKVENRRLTQENELRSQEAKLATIAADDDRRALQAMAAELQEVKRQLFDSRDADAQTRAAKKQLAAMSSALEEAIEAARKQRDESEAILKRLLEEQRAGFENRIKQLQAHALRGAVRGGDVTYVTCVTYVTGALRGAVRGGDAPPTSA